MCSPVWMLYLPDRFLKPTTMERLLCHSPQTCLLLLCKWHQPPVGADYWLPTVELFVPPGSWWQAENQNKALIKRKSQCLSNMHLILSLYTGSLGRVSTQKSEWAETRHIWIAAASDWDLRNSVNLIHLYTCYHWYVVIRCSVVTGSCRAYRTLMSAWCSRRKRELLLSCLWMAICSSVCPLDIVSLIEAPEPSSWAAMVCIPGTDSWSW